MVQFASQYLLKLVDEVRKKMDGSPRTCKGPADKGVLTSVLFVIFNDTFNRPNGLIKHF
jgi:hypothetical protein